MTSPITVLLAGLLASAVALLTGCSPITHTGPKESAVFTLVTLTSGPTSGTGTKEERQEMFQGHMANINRLAESGDMLVAGPFEAPTDKSWRGLFILDADTASARPLVATDPGVIRGEFAPILRPLVASASLRQSLALYRALEAEHAAIPPTDTTSPPALMRAYVFITAADADRASAAIHRANLSIVFRARFTDANGQGGLFVIDSTDTAAVRAALPPTDTGPCSIDGWYSTASHVRLPDDARR